MSGSTRKQTLDTDTPSKIIIARACVITTKNKYKHSKRQTKYESYLETIQLQDF